MRFNLFQEDLQRPPMDVPRISMDIQRCPAHSPLLCVVVVCTPLVITRFPKDFLDFLGSLEDFLGCSNVSKAVRMHLNDFHADFVKVRTELLISLGVVYFRAIPMVFVCDQVVQTLLFQTCTFYPS